MTAALRTQTGVLVEQVVRRFGDRVVLDHLDLLIDDDELVVLLGPSGCGKSTLLRLIAGLDAPTRGTIRIGDKPVTGPVPDIGIVFQRDLLLEWRSVLANVLLPAEIKRLAGLESRASELLQAADIAGNQRFDGSADRILRPDRRHRTSLGAQDRFDIHRGLASCRAPPS